MQVHNFTIYITVFAPIYVCIFLSLFFPLLWVVYKHPQLMIFIYIITINNILYYD